MRIAIISTYPPGKGSLNEYAYHFVRHLRQKKEVSEIIILADELSDGEVYSTESDGAPVRIVPCWRFNAPDNTLRIWQAVRQCKPDVVLFNIQFASFGDRRIPGALGLLAPALIRASGVVTVVLLHNLVDTIDLSKAGFGENPLMERITRTFGAILTRLLLRADMVAVTIPKYVDILTGKYHAGNAVLAPHGAFEEAPPPDLDVAKPAQIMTFGKFGTYKKLEVLLDAFQMLPQGEHAPELVIAGTDSPNAAGYLAGIQRQYAHVGNVQYLGYIDEKDVPTLFRAATVVVFPYNSTTGSSGVLHQAGNYGKAVVLPNFGDFAELITEEGYTGEFFEANDPASLAAAIRTYLDNPTLRHQAGMQNYLAAAGIPMAEVVDWYLLHFDRLLNQHKAQPRRE